MKNLSFLIAKLGMLLLVASHAHQSLANEDKPTNEALPEAIYQAQNLNKKVPLLSASNPQANEALAYATQFQVVRHWLKHDTIAGFKAGLTSTAGQKKFNVSEPLAGVLFAKGQVRDPGNIYLSRSGKLMLETEIGFRLKSTIEAPLANITALKQHIGTVFPAIEMPDLNFASTQPLTGLDIIAANVAANDYLLGEEHPFNDQLDLNQLIIGFYLDDAPLFEGRGSDASGDQWQALLWLVNKMLAEGYTLQKGNLFITGALGKMVPAQVGRYKADFGDLGTIEFEVKP